MPHLICKINLNLRYLKHLDSRVVRTSDIEYVVLGSIPGGRVSNFLLGPWGTEVRFRLRSFFVIFLVRVEVVSARASRDQIEPTDNFTMADITQSRNTCLCCDSLFGNVKEFE